MVNIRFCDKLMSLLHDYNLRQLKFIISVKTFCASCCYFPKLSTWPSYNVKTSVLACFSKSSNWLSVGILFLGFHVVNILARLVILLGIFDTRHPRSGTMSTQGPFAGKIDRIFRLAWRLPWKVLGQVMWGQTRTFRIHGLSLSRFTEYFVVEGIQLGVNCLFTNFSGNGTVVKAHSYQ